MSILKIAFFETKFSHKKIVWAPKPVFLKKKTGSIPPPPPSPHKGKKFLILPFPLLFIVWWQGVGEGGGGMGARIAAPKSAHCTKPPGPAAGRDACRSHFGARCMAMLTQGAKPLPWPATMKFLPSANKSIQHKSYLAISHVVSSK